MLSLAVTPNTSPETSPAAACSSPSEQGAAVDVHGKGQDIDAVNLQKQFNEAHYNWVLGGAEGPSPPLAPVGNPLGNLTEICSCSDCKGRGSLWDHIQKLSAEREPAPPRATLFPEVQVCANLGILLHSTSILHGRFVLV